MKATQPSLRPGIKQMLLSFPRGISRGSSSSDQKGVLTYFTQVYRNFLPKGLIFWGATDQTVIHSVQIGNQSELDIGTAQTGIPARYFETGRSFEELEALAAAGELEGVLDLRQVVQLSEVCPGLMVRVDVAGPFTAFCMWGLIEDGSAPPQVARIERQLKAGPLRPEEPPLESWLGQVIDRKLAGDFVVLEVEGPTAEVVATLLSAQIGKAQPWR